jgi:N,N-dimethylformamidase beta subunit-like, C-terminal
MRRPSALLLAPAVALIALASSDAAVGSPLVAAPPVLVGASPIVDRSDGVSVTGQLRRVTFSPDGDGRNDVVRIGVRAHAGDALTLRVTPASRSGLTRRAGTAKRGVTTVVWTGLQSNGVRYPDGSYVLRVCDAVTSRCAKQRVVAHLRVLTTYVQRATAVDAGETIRFDISSDLEGPFTVDFVSAADPGGDGIGTAEVASAGWSQYRVPDVPHGGLWLLRVRDGSAVDHFPLVVHEPTLPLDDPPPHTALVVYPYLTWRAYDDYDENRDGQVDSWYAHPLDPVVPLYGPFEPVAESPTFTGREANPRSQGAFAQWMDEHHLVAQHVTDVELGELPSDVLQKYSMIVFEGHTEYYELQTYDKVLAYRNAGGRLYFFQGNPFYGQAQIVGTSVYRRSYRYRTATRSDFGLAGVGFRSCCWPASIRPQYVLAPGAVEQLPWAFTGTGLADGDPFGIAAGEVDTTDAKLSPPGTFALATATVPVFEPAKLSEETEGWLGTTPIPYEPAWVKPRRIVIAYAATGEGEVFTWANTGFLKTVMQGYLGLPQAEREQLDRVALNVWEHFLR